jgi:AraC family transcriptional regulator
MLKSHIHIIRTDDCRGIPAAPDSAVLLASADRWTGIKVEHHILSPSEMPEHLVQEHRLVVNIGKPFKFEWKTGNKWLSKHFETGDFIMLSHGEIHTPRWNKEFEFIAIALSPAYTDEIIETHDSFFSAQRVISDNLIYNLSLKFLNELKQGNLAGKVFGESLSVAFAIHLACNYSAKQKKVFAPKGKLSAVQLHQVIDYAHSNIHQNIGLNDLAKNINISPFHFIRLFKQTIGISPYQFMLQLKIERAKQLIQQSEFSLTSIAYQLGFMDQAHFCNAFKKATGVTPLQYKKN